VYCHFVFDKYQLGFDKIKQGIIYLLLNHSFI
jgi:hypothetical protein